MSKSHTTFRRRLLRAGIATVATTATIAATVAPAYAATVTLTLNTSTGPSGSSSQTITASSNTAWLTGVTSPVVTLSIPACQTTYNATASTAVTPSTASAGNIVTGTTLTKISNNKSAIALPSLSVVPSTATTTKYNICVYSGISTSDTLIATAAYSVAAPSGLSTGAVTPTSGPALGGSTITVSGTAFPTTAGSISAMLGGVPLTNVTPVSSTSFTATTPYHASGAVPLAMTTAAGTVTLQNAFTYSNGLVISPNTASSGLATSVTPAYIDVNGSNFLALTFGTFASSTSPVVGTNPLGAAAVFLVKGAYNAGITQATSYTNGPTANCGTVVVISDSELLCQLNLHTGALLSTGVATAASPTVVPDGTYTLTVVSNSASGTGANNDPTLVGGSAQTIAPLGITVSDISSGSTFTVAPY